MGVLRRRGPGELLRTAWGLARTGAGALRMRVAPLVGVQPRYGIAAGYRHRGQIHYFDDVDNSDAWQREVYAAAREIMAEHGLRTVHDVGCGSGYKLVHMLGEFDTVGIDLPETIARVRLRYPERKWVAGSFEEVQLPPADLVVCSDVIEHVADPDALMRFLCSVARDRLVLSTPDRDLVYCRRARQRHGPPANPAHVREWTMAEFADYVSRFAAIERHEITNREQATQMIVARVRN